jgi:phage shock protein A
MLLDDLRNWVAIIAGIIAIGTAIAAWLRAGKTENAQNIQTNAQNIQKVGDRVKLVEQEMALIDQKLEQLPTTDQLHKIEISLTQMSGSISSLNEGLTRVSRSNDRIEDFIKGDHFHNSRSK